jgi:hypothetical protein
VASPGGKIFVGREGRGNVEKEGEVDTTDGFESDGVLREKLSAAVGEGRSTADDGWRSNRSLTTVRSASRRRSPFGRPRTVADDALVGGCVK